MIYITQDVFETFSNKQRALDRTIQRKLDISPVEWDGPLSLNHKLALRVEVSEFINECRDSWKYWKKKAVIPERIIDEAVDIIHFIHLILNKSNLDTEAVIRTINNYVKSNPLIENSYDPRLYMMDMYLIETTDDLLRTYADLLVILEGYNFDLEDIVNAYENKNKENYRRQESGY